MDPAAEIATMTRDELRAQHCRPLAAGGAETPAAVRRQLTGLPGWAVVEDALERDFVFPDYAATIRFVDAVAAMAEEEDHHPEMLVGYGRCTVRWNTHSVGGISRNDFVCAVRTDDLYERQPPLPGSETASVRTGEQS